MKTPIFERWYSGLLATITLAAVIMAIFLWSVADSADIKLAWNPNPETNITGYILSIGTASGVYSSMLSVGPVTRATATGLDPGRVYYFALRAVNSSGLISAYSTEVNRLVTVNDVVKKTKVTPLYSVDMNAWVAAGSFEVPYSPNLFLKLKVETAYGTYFLPISPP